MLAFKKIFIYYVQQKPTETFLEYIPSNHKVFFFKWKINTFPKLIEDDPAGSPVIHIYEMNPQEVELKSMLKFITDFSYILKHKLRHIYSAGTQNVSIRSPACSHPDRLGDGRHAVSSRPTRLSLLTFPKWQAMIFGSLKEKETSLIGLAFVEHVCN